MIPALSVSINHAQPALLRDRQWVVARGQDFEGDNDGQFESDIWVDPITHRLMLRPGPMYDKTYTTNWWNNNAGIFAKLRKADFTDSLGVALGAGWVESDQFANGA